MNKNVTVLFKMRLLAVVVILKGLCCDAQIFYRDTITTKPTPKPLPFPPCHADDIECLRRGIRSFFFMMDAGLYGMKPVDPTWVNTVALSLPEDGLRFLIRNANVTGARWTRLADRKFNLEGGKSGVLFTTDLHITGEITMETTTRVEPYFGFITIDVQDVESNVTYAWRGKKGIDNEDYILIGHPRIAVRNMRTPTFFIQVLGDQLAPPVITKMLQQRNAVLDFLTNEFETAVMHTVVDNFRTFASKIPVKVFYQYYR